MKKLKFLISIFIISLIGCSYPPRVEKMIVANPNLRFESSNKSINIICKEIENSNWSPKRHVKAAGFKASLIESIKNANLFSEVAEDSDSSYELITTILYQRIPDGGFNMSGALKVAYVINNNETHEKIYDKTITTNAEASVGDAFNASARSRLVGERMVSKNISTFLWDISKVQL